MSINRVCRVSLVAGLALGLFGSTGHGEGTSEEALLIIDPSSPASMYVGNYYKDARQIPDANVLYMDPAAVDYAAFVEANLDGLFGTLANRGLDQKVDFIILGPGAPFYIPAAGYVNDTCAPVTRFALASAYTMAFLTDDLLNGPISVITRQGYWDSGITVPAFDSSLTWYSGSPSDDVRARRYFIGAMLGYDGERGNTLQETLDMIDRSVAADGTRQAGTFYFMNNASDPARNVRAPQFAGVVNDLDFYGGVGEVIDGVLPTGRHDCLGVMTGAANPDIDGANFTLLPGSFCDHLTSWAATFDRTQQTKMSRWIVKGASGSVGAVEEPCNYTGKFPRAELHLFSFLGATLGEAYFRSAEYVPFQMLLYGDPLTRPFAYVPSYTVYSEPTNPVSGSIDYIFVADTSDPAWQIERVEAYIDGELAQTLAGTGGLLTIDTTTLTDGYHELRLLAYSAAPQLTAGRLLRDLIVDNSGESAALTPNQTSGDLGTLFSFSYNVQAASIDEVQLLQAGRVLASSAQLSGQFDIFGQTMGAGPATVQLQARRANGEIVRSEPIQLDITYGDVTPSGVDPVAYGYSRTVLADQPFVLELPATFDDAPGEATFTIVTPPIQATIHAGATGGYRILVPGQNASGDDQLTFNVSTPSGSSQNATITWTYGGEPGIPGDLNGDGCVDQSDLGILLASYEVDDGGDIDGDGDTDQSDLGVLLANYEVGC
ncbi:MAG: hypothetical protein ACF8NJ_00665 [Phycisphaerales bacterium JB038]